MSGLVVTNSSSGSFLSVASLRSYIGLIWCTSSLIALGIAHYYNDVATPPQIFMLLLLNALSAHAVFLFTLSMKLFLGGEDSFGSTMLGELRTRFIAIAGHKVYIFVTLLLSWKHTSFTLSYMVLMMFLSQLAHACKLKVDKLLQENERNDSRKNAIKLVTVLISLICTASLVLGVFFWRSTSSHEEVEQVQRLSNFLSSDGSLHYRLLLCVDNLTVFIKMVNSIILVALDSNTTTSRSLESPADIAAASDAYKDRTFLINTFFPSCIDIVSFFHLLHVESLVGFNLSLFDLYIWLSLRAVGERLVDRYNKYKIYRDMKYTLDVKLSVYMPKKRQVTTRIRDEKEGIQGLRRRGGGGGGEEVERNEVEVEDEKECSICMENITAGRICPTCKNVFHRHCLREFFVRKGELAWTCPLCVAVLRPAQGIAQLMANNLNAPPPPPRQQEGGIERGRGEEGYPEIRPPLARPPQPLLFNAMRGVFETFLGAARVDENSEIGRNLMEMFPNSQRQALFDYASRYGVNATVDAVANGLIPVNEEEAINRDQTIDNERRTDELLDDSAEEAIEASSGEGRANAEMNFAAIEAAANASAIEAAANEAAAIENLREERRLRRLTAAEARLAQLR